MDEIEAALDEAERRPRTHAICAASAGKTQFIVITHRRGTMEEADVLYGVTMQERGVQQGADHQHERHGERTEHQVRSKTMGIFAKIQGGVVRQPIVLWRLTRRGFLRRAGGEPDPGRRGRGRSAVDAVEELRKRALYEKTHSATATTSSSALRDILAKKLDGGRSERWTSPPRRSVVLIIGVNGVGKTTTIGKLASRYKKQGKTRAAVRRRIPSVRRRPTSSRSGRTAPGVDIVRQPRGRRPRRGAVRLRCRRRRREMWTSCSATRRAACTTRST